MIVGFALSILEAFPSKDDQQILVFEEVRSVPLSRKCRLIVDGSDPFVVLRLVNVKVVQRLDRNVSVVGAVNVLSSIDNPFIIAHIRQSVSPT